MEFEIDNNSSAIRAYISVIFGDNKRYLSGISAEKETENTYVKALLKMLSANGALKSLMKHGIKREIYMKKVVLIMLIIRVKWEEKS